MGNSLMVGASKMGMDFRAAAPKACQPSESLVANMPGNCKRDGCKNILLPRMWMMQLKVSISCIPMYGYLWENLTRYGMSGYRLLKPYQVNMKVIEKDRKSESQISSLPSGIS